MEKNTLKSMERMIIDRMTAVTVRDKNNGKERYNPRR